MEPCDVAIAQAQLAGQDFIRVFAQHWRAGVFAPRMRRTCGGIPVRDRCRSPGCSISAKSGFVCRGTRVFGHHLSEGLIGPPADIMGIEGGANFVQGMRGTPAADGAGDGIPCGIAVFLPSRSPVRFRPPALPWPLRCRWPPLVSSTGGYRHGDDHHLPSVLCGGSPGHSCHRHHC